MAGKTASKGAGSQQGSPKWGSLVLLILMIIFFGKGQAGIQRILSFVLLVQNPLKGSRQTGQPLDFAGNNDFGGLAIGHLGQAFVSL